MDNFADPVLNIDISLSDIHKARYALREYAATFDRYTPEYAIELRAMIDRLDNHIQKWIEG